MLEALAVTVLGAGLFAIGIALQPFYDIGIIVILIGLVGVAVRGGSWIRWLVRTLLAAEPRK